MTKEANAWKLSIDKKRQSLIQAIPEEWRVPDIKEQMENAGFINPHDYLDSILPEDEVKITNSYFHQLIDLIKEGTLSSYTVVKAFCHRAALAHQLVNCCIEIFFDEALEQAKKLDDYYKETGKLKGPLHGVPISLKDQVDLVGKDSSIGYVSLLDKPKQKDALIAEILQGHGAIFYVKTTVPMAMMLPETHTTLQGYTNNGVNIKLSAGGSSGGEGSLVGTGGSCMGFGTDIGGSIRIPSAFQGLYGLKPSVGRISYMGVTNSYSGQEVCPSVIGPMTKSLKDVQLITELIVSSGAWKVDPKVLPVPWKDVSELKERPLTIGIWRSSAALSPHPPTQRAIREVEAFLKSKGHKTVELTFTLQPKILSTLSKVLGADGAAEVETICGISGEPVDLGVKQMIQSGGIYEPMTVNAWWDLANEAYVLKQEFYKYWSDTGIDAIVAPIWPSTSSLPYGQPTIDYTSPFNLCDCASVVLPVTTVDAAVDTVDTSYKPLNSIDEEMHQSYDPELFDKMPVCVQLVTKKLEEEKALFIASIIDDISK